MIISGALAGYDGDQQRHGRGRASGAELRRRRRIYRDRSCLDGAVASVGRFDRRDSYLGFCTKVDRNWAFGPKFPAKWLSLSKRWSSCSLARSTIWSGCRLSACSLRCAANVSWQRVKSWISNTFLQILDATVRLATPLLLACLAGLYSERAGIFDIGLEGKMLAAAFISAAAAFVTGSVWLGLLAGIGASMLLSIVHGMASITFRGNQLISGVAINFLAAGLTVVACHQLVRTRRAHALSCLVAGGSHRLTCPLPKRSQTYQSSDRFMPS